MPRANRYSIPGHVWHITQRCHKKDYFTNRIEIPLFAANKQLSWFAPSLLLSGGYIIMRMIFEHTKHIQPGYM